MRWAYIINGSEKTFISQNNCHFLESEITEVDTRTKEQEIAGGDGVLVGSNTFGPFELTLKFYYDGIDKSDLILFTEKIKGVIHTRNAMYVVNSDIPGRKYAFNSAKIDWERITNSDITFSITFNCFKGFSESVNTTDDEFFFESNWMFENGIPLDFEPKYHHTSNQFTIWNGSTDTIDPRNIHHQLQIKMNIKATDGFELVNYTTGDIFRYNKSISPGVDFVLSGVHAYCDNNKVGIDTNRGVITLAPGKNILKIRGDVSSQNVVFKFPFIYR
ncbi:MAG: phage tail domain-containing protein [Staphylococcus equorum]